LTPWIVPLVALTIAWSVPARAGGEATYASKCAVCHQGRGQGVRAMYPPLARLGGFARSEEGRAFLVHVVAFGMSGTVVVDRQRYFGVMPGVPKLSDADLADVLDYVLSAFDGAELPKDFRPFTTDEVRRYRGAQLSTTAVYSERERLIKEQGAESLR
jgi:cytochrome c